MNQLEHGQKQFIYRLIWTADNYCFDTPAITAITVEVLESSGGSIMVFMNIDLYNNGINKYCDIDINRYIGKINSKFSNRFDIFTSIYRSENLTILLIYRYI